MNTIRSFEDLKCWQRARIANRAIYRSTKNERFKGDYELVRQIRKSSISVMSNIAEGFERDGNREFINFLSIAKGSAGEVISQLYIARDENYLSEEDFLSIRGDLLEISKMIAGLMRYLRESKIKGQKFRN